jgi:phosphoribosylglycinamide synthetase-like protein
VSLAPQNTARRRIVFVSRNMTAESLRHAQAIRSLAGVCLLGIAEHLPEEDVERVFEEVACVRDAHDPDQLIAAARKLGEKHGELDRIVTTHEILLEAVARASEALGLQGLGVSTVRRVLDKSCLKPILERAGISTARDRVLTSGEDARRFASEAGLPIVLKPLGGSGGLATWCIRSREQLEIAIELMQPSAENVVLAEEYLRGQELCIDTITIENEPRFYSLCYYRPSILEALEDPRIQWSCVMPRDIGVDLYRVFIDRGLAAVRALSIGNAMTHMEGFLVEGGVRFTDATLRPAGARIGPMLAYAYDMDPYFAWARVAVDGCFDGPWERKYAVGTIFLRGLGSGLVKEVHGVESVELQIGKSLVDVRLPRVGAAKSVTYTGDGYITVRHPETAVVEDTLDFIARTVEIRYSHPESPVPEGEASGEQWKERLQYSDKQLYKPPWENDSLRAISKG